MSEKMRIFAKISQNTMSNINLLKRFLRASAAKTVFAIMLPGIAAIDAIAENDYSVYVDSHGRMRRSDTKEEVRFYGTNYTLPLDRKSVV